MSEDRYPKQNERKNNKPKGNTPSFKKPIKFDNNLSIKQMSLELNKILEKMIRLKFIMRDL